MAAFGYCVFQSVLRENVFGKLVYSDSQDFRLVSASHSRLLNFGDFGEAQTYQHILAVIHFPVSTVGFLHRTYLGHVIG